ncbi:MAG TPA: hypothetical protein VFH73_00575 [Polyangia bacterium]|jgi:hypothetical protein|nr:hypothetical protein [Polyangia bacterium]
MSRTSYFSFALALAGFLGFGLGVGCETAAQDPSPEDRSDAQSMAILAACGLDDGTIEHGHGAHLHACDPQDTKKTTICHVPPGNPANAHTICIGNPAVPAHLSHHPDYLGPCKREIPCPPPATTGTGGGAGGGGSGDTGAGGSDTTTGTGGSGGLDTTTGTGGAAGSDAGQIIVP